MNTWPGSCWSPWVKPDQATIVRHKVYTFRSLLANTWRKGRMLVQAMPRT